MNNYEKQKRLEYFAQKAREWIVKKKKPLKKWEVDKLKEIKTYAD